MSAQDHTPRFRVGTGTPLHVILTEADEVTRRSLKDALTRRGVRKVTEVFNNRAAVTIAKELSPDVVILDGAGQFLEALEAATKILTGNHRVKVILLSLHSEKQYVLAALRAGVHGYVLKTRAVADLGDAIGKVWKQGVYLGAGISADLRMEYPLREWSTILP